VLVPTYMPPSRKTARRAFLVRLLTRRWRKRTNGMARVNMSVTMLRLAMVRLRTSTLKHLALAPPIQRDSMGQHWNRKTVKKVTMCARLKAIKTRHGTRTLRLMPPSRSRKRRADALTIPSVGLAQSPIIKFQNTPRLGGSLGGISISCTPQYPARRTRQLGVSRGFKLGK